MEGKGRVGVRSAPQNPVLEHSHLMAGDSHLGRIRICVKTPLLAGWLSILRRGLLGELSGALGETLSPKRHCGRH